MGTLKTQAIVLRHADYRENDRMLTLLSPAYGRMDVIARGCRRPKSPLLAGSEWFAEGEYVLYVSGGHATVTSCLLQESFYPLRQDYALLQHATYMLSLCETVSQPGERALGLFKLITRSLSRLCYQDLEPRAVTAAFLLFLTTLEGYRPVLDRCARCGRALGDAQRPMFSIEDGGLVCGDCLRTLANAVPLRPAGSAWMEDVLKVGVEKTDLPVEDAPLRLLMDYAEAKLECHPASGRGLR